MEKDVDLKREVIIQLGHKLTSNDADFYLTYNSNGTQLRVTKGEVRIGDKITDYIYYRHTSLTNFTLKGISDKVLGVTNLYIDKVTDVYIYYDACDEYKEPLMIEIYSGSGSEITYSYYYRDLANNNGWLLDTLSSYDIVPLTTTKLAKRLDILTGRIITIDITKKENYVTPNAVINNIVNVVSTDFIDYCRYEHKPKLDNNVNFKIEKITYNNIDLSGIIPIRKDVMDVESFNVYYSSDKPILIEVHNSYCDNNNLSYYYYKQDDIHSNKWSLYSNNLIGLNNHILKPLLDELCH